MQVRDGWLESAEGPVARCPTPNRSGRLEGGAPRFVVMHFTASGPAERAVAWLTDPAARASAHLVVGRNGAITQLGAFDARLWHAGRSSWQGLDGLNAYSVGVELANWGRLDGGPGAWVGWTGDPVPDVDVVATSHRNAPERVHGWERYPAAQIAAAAAAVAAILDAYGLFADAVIGHDDIAPERKSDPGPAFDMAGFRARLGRPAAPQPEIYRVGAASGLNLRRRPGIGAPRIQTLAAGRTVAVHERRGPWWRITTAGAEPSAGWVAARWLRSARES